jgi:hypothetical protein
MQKIFIHQIYYDNISRDQVDKNFIPLNNSNGPDDWFEFYPILNFLINTDLIEDGWYGFLSPKFSMKTGVTSNQLISTLIQYSLHANVALFSPAWDQLAYFKNPFEQGEFRHPGLLDISQNFLNQSSHKIDLTKLVTHSSTAVFSNFIVAKPEYWRAWLDIAIQFYEYAESNELGGTSYLDAKSKMAPMKTFIQERLSSLILSKGSFKTLAMDFGQSGPIFDQLFDSSPRTRKMLQACDLLKEQYSKTKDESYLQMYFKIRHDINFKQPHPRASFFIKP